MTLHLCSFRWLPRSDHHTANVLLLLFSGAIALAGTGCGVKKVQAQPSFDGSSRPTIPASQSPSLDSSDNAPPDLESSTPPPLVFPVARSAPPRPRNSATQPNTDAEAEPEPLRPVPPQLQPRLSAKEQIAAEHQTNESIQVAERNLRAALGRQLNPTEIDLIGKIRTFLGQAREAIRDGDWLRALNLAKKAQVLSAELVSS